MNKGPIRTTSNHIKVGIVGSTNTGKSSLFNVFGQCNLASVSPTLFTTCDPVCSTIYHQNDRLEWLKNIFCPQKLSNTCITIIDTSPIVQNSHKETRTGLACANALKCADVLCHVLRGFADPDVTHFNEVVNPINDMLLVDQEIMMHDLAIIESAICLIEEMVFKKEGGKWTAFEMQTLSRAWQVLAGSGRPDPLRNKQKRIVHRYFPPASCTGAYLRTEMFDANEKEILNKLDLLTTKESFYVLNVSRLEYLRHRSPWVEALNNCLSSKKCLPIFLVSIEFENDLLKIYEQGDKALHDVANPTHHSAMKELEKHCYRALNLIHFFTCSSVELRCWCITNGKNTNEAAAVVDTDYNRYFIRGEVIAFEDYYDYNGDMEKLLADSKMRYQGKKYMISDGDIIEFKYHVPK